VRGAAPGISSSAQIAALPAVVLEQSSVHRDEQCATSDTLLCVLSTIAVSTAYLQLQRCLYIHTPPSGAAAAAAAAEAAAAAASQRELRAQLQQAQEQCTAVEAQLQAATAEAELKQSAVQVSAVL
jgi:multidrug resistance efflux pump